MNLCEKIKTNQMKNLQKFGKRKTQTLNIQRKIEKSHKYKYGNKG